VTGTLHLHELSPGDDGSATVLLLHGLTDSGACWPDAVRRWAPRGWRLVALDARGHGRSPRWDDEALAGRPGRVMAEDVARLLPRLAGGGRLALVGHSMGAAVGVAAAAALPHLVAGVVAEDPPWPLPPIVAPDRVRARGYTAGHADVLSRPHPERVARQRAEAPAWPAVELDGWSSAKEQTDVRLLATGDIVPPTPWPDLLAALARADVPVLVVSGTRDVRVGGPSESEARRRGAAVVRIEGAGHCLRRDRPDEFHAAVDPALTRWLSPTAG
jgi:pimeloyl-ACP methyl ester carboxylesterase